MGTLFRYIKDSALETEDSNYYKDCHCCGLTEVPLYSAQGFILTEDGSIDKNEPDSEVFVACESCISSGKIARFGEFEMIPFLKENFENWEQLILKLRVTPQIPMLLQREDWVVCCNDICEFIGEPDSIDDLVDFTSTAKYWDRGKDEFARNFKEDGQPECLSEVSKFECLHCHKKYWIDQYS